VPHLAARSIPDETALDRLVGRLATEAAVDDVLVIAGGTKQPVGGLASSLDILRSGALERHGIRRVGVAGHPEGSPDIPADAERTALVEKNELAERLPFEFRVVTQFALAPDAYVTWERRAREWGNRLPVYAGIPGPTSPTALVKYALACGVGPSLEVLRKQTGGLVKLATTRHWKPDAIAEGIARSVAQDAGSLIRGLHLFPFGGVEASAEWLAPLRAEQAVRA
jgi:methylenetetrahydrofolate reductase (NADPH)